MSHLDVVAVAYRSERFLPRLVADLESMTDSKFSLYLFDNTGNPKTLTMAWNDLARQGNGEFVAFLNTDICVSPHWDRKLIDALARHPEVGVALPTPFGPDRPMVLGNEYTLGADMPSAGDMGRLATTRTAATPTIFKEHPASFYAVLLRRATYDLLCGFDERFRYYGQDHDFQRRLTARKGRYAAWVPDCYFYHAPSSSLKQALTYDDFDFHAEMVHCGTVERELKEKKLTEWDLLSDSERRRVRETSEFTAMPRRKGGEVRRGN